MLPGCREESEPREMNEPPQSACKNQHTTHKGCTWRTHKHADKHTHNIQTRRTLPRTHTIWQRGSRKSNKSRLQKLSLRSPKRRAAESLGMKREGFVPFYYTASNSFKELVWVCVKGWGGRRTYHTHGVWLHVGPCQTDMGLGGRFHSQKTSSTAREVWKVLAPELQASGILESLVAREFPSCDLIWSYVYHGMIYAKYYKYY